MPKTMNVEKKIWDIEGFAVRIRWADRDVRDDHTLPKNFPYENSAIGQWTVEHWKHGRFWPALTRSSPHAGGSYEFPVGTIFTRQSIQPPIGTHFGVHIGNGWVLDLQKGDANCARVREIGFDEFAANLPVQGQAPRDDILAAFRALCETAGVEFVMPNELD